MPKIATATIASSLFFALGACGSSQVSEDESAEPTEIEMSDVVSGDDGVNWTATAAHRAGLTETRPFDSSEIDWSTGKLKKDSPTK